MRDDSGRLAVIEASRPVRASDALTALPSATKGRIRTIGVRFLPADHEDLRLFSASVHRTMSVVVRLAMEEWLAGDRALPVGSPPAPGAKTSVVGVRVGSAVYEAIAAAALFEQRTMSALCGIVVLARMRLGATGPVFGSAAGASP